MNKKMILIFVSFIFFNNCISQNVFKDKLEGMYFVKTQVENYETNEPVNVICYLYFDKQSVTLNYSNNEFAVCEGKYFYKEKNEELYLIRDNNDGRPCPQIENIVSDKSNKYDAEIIYVKKLKGKFYIKSKRFYNTDWQLIQKKT